MDHVKKYMELYPIDKVTIIGGAAAYLLTRKYGKLIPLKDIDVNIETSESVETVLKRWESVLPSTYTNNYNPEHSNIATFTDTSGVGLSFDIFVNETFRIPTESVNSFHVEEMTRLIVQLSRDLEGRKVDIDLMRSGLIPWSKEEIDEYVNKYQRLFARLQVLVECWKLRKDTPKS